MSDSTQKEGLLSYHLHRHVAGFRPGRPLERIHASDVTKDDWCSRRHALFAASGSGAPDEFIGTAQALAFQMSSRFAEQLVRWAAGAGIAVGDWACMGCGRLVIYATRPESCPYCVGEKFRYEEHRFQSKVSGVSGGIDMIFRAPSLQKDRVVEIKALQKDDFKALKMPLAEHRLRTNLYLRLVEESGDPAAKIIDRRKATILYMTKGGYGERSKLPSEWGLDDIPYTPFKEFTIERDDGETGGMSEAAAKLYAWMKDPGSNPVPDGICATPYGDIASRCLMRSVCFSGRFPSTGIQK